MVFDQSLANRFVRVAGAEKHAVRHDDGGASARLKQSQKQGDEQQFGFLGAARRAFQVGRDFAFVDTSGKRRIGQNDAARFAFKRVVDSQGVFALELRAFDAVQQQVHGCDAHHRGVQIVADKRRVVEVFESHRFEQNRLPVTVEQGARGVGQKTRRAARWIANDVARRRIDQIDHHLNDVARRAKLPVASGCGQLRQQIFIQIAHRVEIRSAAFAAIERFGNRLNLIDFVFGAQQQGAIGRQRQARVFEVARKRRIATRTVAAQRAHPRKHVALDTLLQLFGMMRPLAPAQVLRVGRENRVLEVGAVQSRHVFAALFFVVQATQKQQISDLLNHFERIGQAVGGEIEPQSVNFGAQFGIEHDLKEKNKIVGAGRPRPYAHAIIAGVQQARRSLPRCLEKARRTTQHTKVSHTMTWPKVKLGDVCEVMMGQSPPGDQYNFEELGKPLITGSGQLGELYPKPTQWSKAGARSSIAGDLILSIRASIGDLNLSDREYYLGRGVAGLRPTPKLDSRYLWFAIGITSSELASKGTGSTFLQVRRADVENIEIPLPPLAEQKRLAAILDHADELRRVRRESLRVLDELAQSLFLELFGDPATNPKGWNVVKLGELMKIRRGASPRPIDQFMNGTVNWIKIGDGTKGSDIYLEQCADKVTEEGTKRSVFLKEGSLIFANCGVSLGFARILKVDGCIHDGWLAFENITPQLDKIFLLKALNAMTMNFRAMAPDGTQPNLNTGIMKDFRLILPPLSLQQQFAEQIEELEAIKRHVRESSTRLDALFASLQARAFAGELSEGERTLSVGDG